MIIILSLFLLLCSPVYGASPVENFAILSPVVFEDFESVGDWTLAGAGASIATESTLVKSGATSIRVTMVNAGGSASITKDYAAIDLSSPGHIGIRLYVVNGIRKIQLLISNDAGFSNYFEADLVNTTYPYREGWNYFDVPKELFAIAAGSPTWSNVNRIRIAFEWLGGETGYAVVDSFSRSLNARAKAIIHFDHAYSSFWSEGGYQYLVDRGLKCDFPLLVSTPLGSVGIASEFQVRTAYGLGFGVTLHSNSHAAHTTLTEAQVRSEVELSQAYMSSLGFTRGLSLYTFPQGDTGFTTDAVNIDTIMRSEGIAFARGGRASATNYKQAHALGLDNPYQIVSVDIGNNLVSLATAKTYVDDAIRLGGGVVFVFHGLNATTADADEWVTADFKAWIDYLVSRSAMIDVVTLEEYMATMQGARFRRY